VAGGAELGAIAYGAEHAFKNLIPFSPAGSRAEAAAVTARARPPAEGGQEPRDERSEGAGVEPRPRGPRGGAGGGGASERSQRPRRSAEATAVATVRRRASVRGSCGGDAEDPRERAGRRESRERAEGSVRERAQREKKEPVTHVVGSSVPRSVTLSSLPR
jgi:hypothetical protein